MTKLSVNINKFATIRNARGGNNPDIIKVAQDCEKFGADGITIHPRPDERHIRYRDVIELKKIVTTEFNIEGNPQERYLELVRKVVPTQATLVPDSPEVLTSDTGWDTIKHEAFLIDIINELKALGIRSSIFVNPEPKMIEGAKKVGTDRIEFYTGDFAKNFQKKPESAVKAYIECAKIANDLEIEINAGHDLDLHNLNFLKKSIPTLKEVSIGHALVCDAIYYGLENTIQMYKRELLLF